MNTQNKHSFSTNGLAISSLISLLALLSGGFIYIAFRPTEHLFFNWMASFGLENHILNIRKTQLLINLSLPEWFIYSLPNGLWAFAYSIFISSIWFKSTSNIKYIWYSSIPILVLGYEILQLFEIIKGTFCLQDIVAGGAGIIIGILIRIKISKTQKL